MNHGGTWRRSAAWLALGCAVMFGAAQAQTQELPLSAKPAGHWQALARADLDAARAAILAAHPGLGDWVERAYGEALALEPRVFNYDSALALVRYYAHGFPDAHLLVSDDARGSDPRLTNGIALKRDDREFRVSATLPDWPVPLPPVGARLLQCDGDVPATVIARRIAPFVGRSDGAAARDAQALSFHALALRGLEIEGCSFEATDGRRAFYAVRYLPRTLAQLAPLLAERAPVGADALPVEGGRRRLPSGNHLWLPPKDERAATPSPAPAALR